MRYTSFAQFISIVTQGKLPLIRIDLFRDPFEGSAPSSSIDQQLLLDGRRNMTAQQMPVQHHHYANHSGSLIPLQTSVEWWAEMTARRRNLTYSTHASCWRWGPESEGMWRLYCGEKEGVAFQTTFARLEQSIVEAHILAGKIRYEDYNTTLPFTELLDHVMHKRVGFAFEQEVRLLRLDEDHYGNLCNRTTDEKHSPCLPIPWSMKAAIDRILVSPYADDWYLDAVRATARLADADLESRVGWSELKEKPKF
jgi:hypothetical protein